MKYPTADANATYAIIDVSPEDWAVDLEHTIDKSILVLDQSFLSPS